jgi:hypothetical protein
VKQLQEQLVAAAVSAAVAALLGRQHHWRHHWRLRLAAPSSKRKEGNYEKECGRFTLSMTGGLQADRCVCTSQQCSWLATYNCCEHSCSCKLAQCSVTWQLQLYCLPLQQQPHDHHHQQQQHPFR